MSQAPHLLPSGFGNGDVMVHDALELDGLRDYFTHQSMGALTEVANARHGGVGRAEQDAFAAASHTKAAKAWKDSLFADEVVPVSVPNAGENHRSSPRTRESAPTSPPLPWPGCGPLVPH